MIYPFSLNGSTEVIAWWPLPEPAEPKEIGMGRIDVWIPADERLPEVFRQKEED